MTQNTTSMSQAREGFQPSMPWLRISCITVVLLLHGAILAAVLYQGSETSVTTSQHQTVATMLLSESPAAVKQANVSVSDVQPLTEPAPAPRIETPPPPAPALLPKQVSLPKPSTVVRPPPPPVRQVAIASTPQAGAPPSSAATQPRTEAASQNASPSAANTGDASHDAPAVIEPGTHCPKPEYPKMSRRMLEEGVVTLRFLIGADGHVIQSEVEKTSGFRGLDEAARNALSKCQFQPGKTEGQLTQSWAAIKYSWRLK